MLIFIQKMISSRAYENTLEQESYDTKEEEPSLC